MEWMSKIVFTSKNRRDRSRADWYTFDQRALANNSRKSKCIAHNWLSLLCYIVNALFPK